MCVRTCVDLTCVLRRTGVNLTCMLEHVFI